jgi:hypothetical protein
MKVIDETPFFNEQGGISFADRLRAIMKYGNSWIAEIKAQRSVVAVLEKHLDRSYTILCNVTPPGLEASIPLILIGPPGVFVINVTNLIGMFRAKGDQWGTITGSTFRPEKPNLLTRTERMARAVQIYLQRQGYTELTGVEAILLCSEPSIHVDSLRPIIRVVMRDALERFAISLTQARVALSPEAARDVVGRLHQASRPQAAAVSPAAPDMGTAALQEGVARDESPFPAFELPPERLPGSPVEGAQEAFIDENVLAALEAGTSQGAAARAPTSRRAAAGPRVRRRARLTRLQIILLIGGLIVWCVIVAAFVYIISQDLTF